MGHENSHLIRRRKPANFQLCNVSGYKTNLLEIHAEDPTLHLLFIPGNPGRLIYNVHRTGSGGSRNFYKASYHFTPAFSSELLGGTTSVRAIGQISHTKKISEQVPNAALAIEREGHTHAFSCIEAGSLWVAQHVATLIKNLRSR